MNVILIFTYDVSLKQWEDSGLLSREISLYNKMISDYKLTYTFITFGDESDIPVINNPNIKILPIYKYIKKSKIKSINIIKSFFVPFILKKYIKDSQLIKTNQLNGSWIGIMLKQILKIPLFVRTGYNIYEFKKIQKKSIFVKLFYFVLTKASLRFSDIYTVTSETDMIKIKKISKNVNKISILRNYVSTLQAEKNKSRHKERILSVGRLDSQKNYKMLIDIFDNSEFEIDIVGSGPGKHDLIKYADSKNVKLNLLGNMDNDQLMNLYHKYYFYITTSLYEGNPKALLEAMSSGCIVLCKKNPNTMEIIDNGFNGFYIDNDIETIQLIEEILNDKNLKNKIVENSLKTIERNYLIDKIVNEEFEIYKILTTDK